MGVAEFNQLIDILYVTKDGLGHAALDEALVAGLLELAVRCEFSDSGGQCFCGRILVEFL